MGIPMSACGRPVLVALCLTWICVIRVLAQASNPPSSPIGSEPSNPCNVSETQPAASSGGSPFNGLQLSDSVGDPTAGEMPADGEAGGSSTSTAPQPSPFGGPWNSRPKLTGDWCGLREQLPHASGRRRHSVARGSDGGRKAVRSLRRTRTVHSPSGSTQPSLSPG
jgi:hypothetical protein